LSEKDFGILTLREFDLLYKRYAAAQKVQQMRFGMVTAAIYNTLRSKKSDKVFSAMDFVGGKERRKKQTESEMLSIVKKMDAFFNKKRIKE